MLLTRAPLYRGRSPFSHDLHVLGAPLTFVLSQDQTLQFESFGRHDGAKPSVPPYCSLFTTCHFRGTEATVASNPRDFSRAIRLSFQGPREASRFGLFSVSGSRNLVSLPFAVKGFWDFFSVPSPGPGGQKPPPSASAAPRGRIHGSPGTTEQGIFSKRRKTPVVPRIYVPASATWMGDREGFPSTAPFQPRDFRGPFAPNFGLARTLRVETRPPGTSSDLEFVQRKARRRELKGLAADRCSFYVGRPRNHLPRGSRTRNSSGPVAKRAR